MEWNDKYRDVVRRFWRGDGDMVRRLSDKLTGSARQFDHSGRHATSSVNFLAAHDGFTLTDVVSFDRKHNQANGEGNKDGHGENFSDNMGIEGPSDDPAMDAARAQRRRNMMATLLLSQGTPMILAGDEMGHSQGGNNNAYNQDNPTTWIDWSNPDYEFLAFTRRLIAFRKAHPILRQRLFLHARERSIDGLEDLLWHRPDGTPMENEDWTDPESQILCVEMRTASGSPDYVEREDAIFAVFNAGPETSVTLPAQQSGKAWSLWIDSSRPDAAKPEPVGAMVTCPANCVLVFLLASSP